MSFISLYIEARKNKASRTAQNEFSEPCEGSSTSQKESSLSWLLQELTEAEKDFFEERASILEYDQGLTRVEAEKEALTLILKQRSSN